jgi:hypothetical protein
MGDLDWCQSFTIDLKNCIARVPFMDYGYEEDNISSKLWGIFNAKRFSGNDRAYPVKSNV